MESIYAALLETIGKFLRIFGVSREVVLSLTTDNFSLMIWIISFVLFFAIFSVFYFFIKKIFNSSKHLDSDYEDIYLKTSEVNKIYVGNFFAGAVALFFPISFFAGFFIIGGEKILINFMFSLIMFYAWFLFLFGVISHFFHAKNIKEKSNL